jgi:hypothetical protein
MTIEFIAFVAGLILLIAAIVGGGFEVKELKVPKLGLVARVGSAIFGAVLLLGPTGYFVKLRDFISPPAPVQTARQPDAPPGGQPPAPAPAPPGPVAEVAPEVVIEDELGTNQQYERINVFINGQSAGTLSIDHGQPMQTLVFRAKPGDRYQLTGSEATREGEEVLVRRVRGGGVLPDSPHKRYGLAQLSSQSDQQFLTVAITVRN